MNGKLTVIFIHAQGEDLEPAFDALRSAIEELYPPVDIAELAAEEVARLRSLQDEILSPARAPGPKVAKRKGAKS